MLTAVSSCGFFLLHSSGAVFVLGTRDRIMVAVLWVCTDDVIGREPTPSLSQPNCKGTLCAKQYAAQDVLFLDPLTEQRRKWFVSVSPWMLRFGQLADHLSQVTWCCTASFNLVHSFSCPSPSILLVLLSLHSVSDLLLDPTVSALCFLCIDPEIKALV